MPDKIKVDISTRSVLNAAVVLLMLLLLYLIRDVLVLLFVVAILVATLRPVFLNWSEKIGKSLSIIFILLILIVGLTGFAFLVIPPFVTEIKQLIDKMPFYLDNIRTLRDHFPAVESAFNSLTQSLGTLTESFLSITVGFLGGIASFFTVIILTVYVLLDDRIFSQGLLKIFPPEKRGDVVDLTDKLSDKVGNWLRGQLLLGLIIGTLVFIGLSVIGVKYAIVLAVIAGVLEIVPIIGPIISGLLAALVALTTMSPIFAVIVLAFYVVVQQLENNLLVPKIMQKAVGLPPAIIIVAILIGGKTLGILGALMAIPISALIFVLFQEWGTVKRIFAK